MSVSWGARHILVAGSRRQGEQVLNLPCRGRFPTPNRIDSPTQPARLRRPALAVPRFPLRAHAPRRSASMQSPDGYPVGCRQLTMLRPRASMRSLGIHGWCQVGDLVPPALRRTDMSDQVSRRAALVSLLSSGVAVGLTACAPTPPRTDQKPET